MKSNSSQKNTPAGWQRVKLSDVSEFINGYTFKSSMYSDNGLYKIITIANVQDGFMFIDEPKLINELPSDINNDQILKKGDILVSMTGNVGRVCTVDADNCLLNQRVGKIKPKGIDTSLLYFFLYDRTFLNQMIDSAQGGAQGNLSTGDIKKYEFSIPKSKEEQNRIVSVLETWDRALELLGQKIEAKKQIKKGLMQELLTGKRRLAGFTEKWETVELGEVSKMGSGGTPKSTNENFYGGAIPWVSIADMTANGKFIYSTIRNLSQEGLDNSSAKIYPKGTILYAMYASIGECSIAGVEMSSSQAILGIAAKKDKLDPIFLYYHLVSIKEKIKLQGQQGTQSNLNAGMVKEFVMHLPLLEEQFEIIKIIETADNEIATLEKKLSILKEQKRYLLNNLITGTIRTPVDLVTQFLK